MHLSMHDQDSNDAGQAEGQSELVQVVDPCYLRLEKGHVQRRQDGHEIGQCHRGGEEGESVGNLTWPV